MTDAPFAETHRKTLDLLLEGHPEEARGWTVALRVALAEIDRLTAEVKELRMAAELRERWRRSWEGPGGDA